MGFRGAILSLLIALSAAVGAQQAAPPQPQGTGRISGTVTCADNGKPVPNAIVEVVLTTVGIPRRVTGDEKGVFAIDGLTPGRYALIATAKGYVAIDATASRPAGLGKVIDIADGQRIDKADFTLALPAAIEGQLVDEFGDPAPNVVLQLAQRMTVAGKPRLMPFGGSGRNGVTDDKGHFRIGEMTPGTYYLLALSGPFGVANNSAFSSNPDGLAGFAPTYFPGTDKAASAQPIVVQVGKAIPPVSFALVSARMSSISGTISDPSSKPSAGRLMLLQTQGGDLRAMIPANTTSAADGTFKYQNIPPGTYVLQGYSASGFGSVPIVVPPDGDGVKDVVVRTHAPVNARGRITFEGASQAPPAANVRVAFSPTDFVSGPAGGNRIPTKVNDDLTFEINQLLWFGLIRASAPGWQVKSILLNGVDIADTPHDFQSADVNGLDIVMTRDLGSAAGTVSDGSQPAAGCTVLFFADDEAKRGAASRFLSIGMCKAGTFNVGGLLPGAYLAVAVPPFTPTSEPDPAWLASLAPHATPFRIAGATSVTLALKLVKP